MEDFKAASVDDSSFRLDSRVQSFRLYPPVRWRDVPLNLLLLVLVLLVLTGFNFAASKLLGFLDRDVLLVLIGICAGFQLAIWFVRFRNHSRSGRGQGTTPAGAYLVSDRVRALAADPSRKIEAIRLLQEDSGLGLAEAKAAIEELIRSAVKK